MLFFLLTPVHALCRMYLVCAQAAAGDKAPSWRRGAWQLAEAVQWPLMRKALTALHCSCQMLSPKSVLQAVLASCFQTGNAEMHVHASLHWMRHVRHQSNCVGLSCLAVMCAAHLLWPTHLRTVLCWEPWYGTMRPERIPVQQLQYSKPQQCVCKNLYTYCVCAYLYLHLHLPGSC